MPVLPNSYVCHFLLTLVTMRPDEFDTFRNELIKSHMKSYLPLAFLIFTACSAAEEPELVQIRNLLHDIEPLSEKGYLNIVVEIPAGSSEKWEVNKETGNLEWEQADDSLRVIPYLPYPANYGMVPRTYLPAHLGGDDDPLDVFLLGPARDRGTIAKGRLIGVIKMKDGEEQDDKLLAVDPESWFWPVKDIEDLKRNYSGIVEILTTWLENYKGPGIIEIEAIGGREEAELILQSAKNHFQ